jgi:hypothetical protein
MRKRAEQSAAADCLQRPLRSRFQQQLSASVMLRQLHRNGFAFHFYLRDAIPHAFDIGDWSASDQPA